MEKEPSVEALSVVEVADEESISYSLFLSNSYTCPYISTVCSFASATKVGTGETTVRIIAIPNVQDTLLSNLPIFSPLSVEFVESYHI